MRHVEFIKNPENIPLFVPFSLFYLRERLSWDYLGAGLCLLGAVFFMFRKDLMGG